MLKAIIVDDEQKAIESLSWELNRFADEIEILEVFTDPKAALVYLLDHDVECIFLDIEMPAMDGFQFISKLRNKDQIALVISTAYDQYGIQALKNEAVDYLLKPIDSEDLSNAIFKVLKFHAKTFNFNKLEKLVQEAASKTPEKKIVLKADGKLIFLEIQDILYAESDGNYTTIFLEDGQKILLTKKLKEVGELLPSEFFYRIHNSYIINMGQIKEFLQSDGYVVLKSNHKIPVSRQKKSDFLDLF